MASFLGQINNSGIESDSRNTIIDERKRKRMESNRESARRSRMKKQKRMEDLANEMSRLQIVNSQFVESINGKEQARNEIESMNNLLRVEEMEMTYQLRALNSVLRIVDDANANANTLAVDVLDVRDPLLEPWQFNLPMQPPPADYGMFLV